MARFPPVEKGGKGTDISWSKGDCWDGEGGRKKVGEILWWAQSIIGNSGPSSDLITELFSLSQMET